jgi:DNA-binding CsgD family transcriptional regulator
MLQRKIRRHLVLQVSVYLCSFCDGFHFLYPKRRDRVKIDDCMKRVLLMISLGHNSREIAEDLGISVRNAERKREDLLYALGCNSSAQLVAVAISIGLIDPREYLPKLVGSCDVAS